MNLNCVFPVAAASEVILIRRAGPEDAAQIAAILNDSFAEFVSSYTREAYAATTPAAPEVRQRIEDGPAWVAEWNRAVVGTVSAVWKATNALYIRGMAVKPSARGKSVGRALLNAVETFAIDNGCRRLFLSTTPFLTSAIGLYERFGFVRSADSPHDLFGTPLFTMSKELSGGNEFSSH